MCVRSQRNATPRLAAACSHPNHTKPNFHFSQRQARRTGRSKDTLAQPTWSPTTFFFKITDRLIHILDTCPQSVGRGLVLLSLASLARASRKADRDPARTRTCTEALATHRVPADISSTLCFVPWRGVAQGQSGVTAKCAHHPRRCLLRGRGCYATMTPWGKLSTTSGRVVPNATQ